MLQLISSHTGEYLKEKMLECLELFGIRTCQVLSITTDNGSNVKKAVELMDILQRDDYKSETSDETDSDTSEPDVVGSTETDAIREQEEKDRKNTELIIHNIENIIIDTSEYFSIENIKCSVHALQLAVRDAVRDAPNADDFIKQVNEVSKSLRTKRARNQLRDLNFNGAFKINVATR